YGGTVLTGSYTARRKGETTKGIVTGAVNAAPVEGTFGARNNARIRPADGGGMHLTARLSPDRVAPPHSAWAVMHYKSPRDLSDYDGLQITVASDTRRNDAAVAVGLSEHGGGFYSVTSAATLTGDERTFLVPFADFRGGSDNYHFDRGQVGSLLLGVDNPHGVGEVSFTVRKVELFRLPQPDLDDTAAVVRVNPDLTLDVSGTTEVPKGLFGFHDVYANKPRTPEGKPQPEEYMRRLEPGYLRPLDHVGFSGSGVGAEADKSHAIANTQRTIAEGSPFWRRAVAADALDNIVYCHTMDLWNRPIWMDKPIDAVAAEVEAFYRALGRVGWRPGDKGNPLRRLEVWNEPFMWGRHVNMGFRNPAGKKAWTDPTQHGYIPGKLGADMYSTIFEHAVRGAKAANRNMLLGGPCSPGMNGDDYATFTNYVRRFIDRCHDKIDFLVEHHYFGNPAAYPASYIVATAYFDVRHGRRVPVYNTECNDLSDNAARRAHYNISEILHAIRLCPDIQKGRAVHALWSGYLRNPGEEHAFTLLSPLRGTMLPSDTDTPGLVTAATRGEDGAATVVVHNESGRPREVKLAPIGQVTHRLVLRVDGKDTALETADGRGLDTVRLGHMETVRWTVKSDGRAREERSAVVKRRTNYADVLFARVQPGGNAQGKVHWRGQRVGGKVWLRVITRDVHRGEGFAVLGGRRIPLPWSSSNDGQAVVQDIPIPPALLNKIDTVRFECPTSPTANGFTVYACGIVTE
ncbi:MAG: hypothetical protein ACLFV7_07720, partial [Phycisphaerae bacterium]